jgi:hypothetical protein
MGATFHYEGGLQARKPEGRELECFRAWQEGWALVPGAEPIIASDPGAANGPVGAIHGGSYVASYVGVRGDTAWVLAAGTTGPVRVEWSAGWTVSDTRQWPRSQWFVAARNPRSQRP